MRVFHPGLGKSSALDKQSAVYHRRHSILHFHLHLLRLGHEASWEQQHFPPSEKHAVGGKSPLSLPSTFQHSFTRLGITRQAAPPHAPQKSIAAKECAASTSDSCVALSPSHGGFDFRNTFPSHFILRGPQDLSRLPHLRLDPLLRVLPERIHHGQKDLLGLPRQRRCNDSKAAFYTRLDRRHHQVLPSSRSRRLSVWEPVFPRLSRFSCGAMSSVAPAAGA